VVPKRVVGAWATIGAGAAVVADVPSWVTAKGTPARSDGGRFKTDRTSTDGPFTSDSSYGSRCRNNQSYNSGIP